MSYNLFRVSDRNGDQGASSESIKWNKDGTLDKIDGVEPKIGNSMRVGSVTARSYSSQDWWMTTPVTEILETIKMIVFFM